MIETYTKKAILPEIKIMFEKSFEPYAHLLAQAGYSHAKNIVTAEVEGA